MTCWNGLAEAQQRRLIERGNLEIFSSAEGQGCKSGAKVAIEMCDDEAPGPRFYCLPCAIEELKERQR
jgi:hypothetical protein